MSRPQDLPASFINLFLYGTLLDNRLRAAIIGRAWPDCIPATLRGFRRERVAGTRYPTLRPHSQGRVDGLLMTHVDPKTRARLAAYEGTAYRLKSCLVFASGMSINAYSYVTTIGRATGEDWHFEDWQRRHCDRDIRSVR